ncbi:MAG: hypothetical protein QM796_01555 [Chthoniobacteraceae bacterium]
MKQPAIHHTATALTLTVALFTVGCASPAGYRYEPSIYQIATTKNKDGTVTTFPITDKIIFEHANQVARTLELRGQTARVAREVSGTTQVILAGLSGITALASAGTTAVASLAFASAVTPQLGGVFNAKTRAELFSAGACEIRKDMATYLTKVTPDEGGNDIPSGKLLTKQGAQLEADVNTTLEAVAKSLSESLPELKKG